MPPLDLEEWAQSLYAGSDPVAAEFAREVLELMASDVSEPYRELCESLEHAAPSKGMKAEKALEWLTGEAQALGEIRDLLDKANARTSDPPDVTQDVQTLLDRVEELETELAALKAPETTAALGLEFDL